MACSGLAAPACPVAGQRLPGVLGPIADGRLIAHACDANKGDSGSPILILRDEQYYVLAAHVAEYDVGVTRMGLAVPASALMKAAAASIRD